MKRILTLILLLSFITIGQSQKADIDNKRIHVEYATIPKHYVAPANRTYSVDISGSYKFDKQDLANHLKIRGWEQVEDGTANINLRVAAFSRGQSSYKKRVVEKKNDDGKVISKTTYYKYEATNSGNANLKIYGPQNELDYKKKPKSKKEKKKLMEKLSNPFLQDVKGSGNTDNREYVNYDLSKTYKISTKEHKSLKEAGDEMKRTFESEYQGNLSDYNDNIASRASNYLNNHYGYSRKRDWVKFKTLGSKKHPEYEMFNNAANAMKEILSQKQFNQAFDEVTENINPIIEYFRTTADTYSSNDKHHKRLKAASLFNMAQLYYYLDQPEKAIQIGKEYLEWGHDEKDGKKFIEKSEKLAHLLNFHKMEGRFIPTDEALEDVFLIEDNTEGN